MYPFFPFISAQIHTLLSFNAVHSSIVGILQLLPRFAVAASSEDSSSVFPSVALYLDGLLPEDAPKV